MCIPLEQAKQYLAELEPEHEINQVKDLTWNLTELPAGAKHWHMVIVTKGTISEDMKGYQVFWYNNKVVAYCKNVHYIDFNEVRKLLAT